MKLNADLEHLHSLLLIEVIIVDEGGHESLEIFELILMMKFVTASFLVQVPSVPEHHRH